MCFKQTQQIQIQSSMGNDGSCLCVMYMEMCKYLIHIKIHPIFKLTYVYSVAPSCLALCNPIKYSLQAPLSIGFSRQEYWSELLCPSPGDFPNPGIEPASVASSPLAGEFFTTELSGKP